MKKGKEIPVYLEGKFIERVNEEPLLTHKLYSKWRPIWKVRKVYWEKGKRVNMENRYRKPYEIQSI